jgi:hypothetical protein
MPCQDKEKFRSLDTAEKRQNAGNFTTGKTAKSHRKGQALDEGQVSKNLARRLRAWKNSKACQDAPNAYHRPGSNKK